MTVIDSLYNHSYTVTRKTRLEDGQGGWTETWATVATPDGRMRPASPSERAVALQNQALISHVLYCAADTDIERGDRVSGEGRTWKVLSIREPSYADHHLEVDCNETQQEGEP